jgi:hypothetical protein
MLNLKWTLSAVILAASFAGIAPAASAQTSQHYRGKFTLPFEARFGDVVLPPAAYTITMLDGAKGIRIEGDKTSVTILAANYDLEPGTKKARMIMVDSHGMYALQSFESGSMNTALRFLVTKHPHAGVERAAVKPTIEVGVQ